MTLQTGLESINVSGSFGATPPTMSLRAPGGTTLASQSLLDGSPIGPVTLPGPGTYTIVLDPAGVGTGTLGLRLTSGP